MGLIIGLGKSGGTGWKVTEATHAYGAQWDVTNSSPSVIRIGNLGLHATLPVQSQARGCVLMDNGQVNYYLKPDDWTKKADGTAASLDGTDGQVMVRTPTFYWKFETDGNVRRVMISEFPLPGYALVPGMFHSAFEPTVQRSTSKLASVINLNADYRGGNNNASWDAGVNTLLGRPATALSRTSFKNYARNRGLGWQPYFNLSHKILWYFFLIEYATRNSQLPVNGSLTAEGYRQGGLGNGVTDANSTEWNNFSSYYPFLPCGASNTLGNFTGEVPYEVTNFGGEGVNRTFMVPRYRGIEHPFGHIWKYCEGINIRIFADSVAGIYNDPPSSPANGLRVIVGTSPTGDFVGRTNNIAVFSSTTGWSYTAWSSSWSEWVVLVQNESKYYINAAGSGWVETDNDYAHVSEFYTNDDPDSWSDANYAGYTLRGLLPRANGYMSEAIFGPTGEFLPKVATGGSTTYYADYFYTSLPVAGESLRALPLGGSAYSGSNAGFVYSYSHTSPAYTNANFGSRLCFLGA
jgi:hypothetical protein